MKEQKDVLLTQFATHIITSGDLKRSTLNRYMTLIERFFLFLNQKNISFATATQNDVYHFIDDMIARKLTVDLITETMTALRKFTAFTHQALGYKNITQGIRMPVKTQSLSLSKDDIRKIIKRAEQDELLSLRNRLIIYLYYYHRLPTQSIAELQEEHVSFERAALFDAKKNITVLCADIWAELLREYMTERISFKSFFYTQSYNHVYPLSFQSIGTIAKNALSYLYEPKKQKIYATQIKSSISSRAIYLKKLYEKNHPRTQSL